MANNILCPECFDRVVPRGEEKCCGHGAGRGLICVECGRTRTDDDPRWHCTGSIRDTDGNGKGEP